MQKALLVAALGVAVWMAYWAEKYVSLANSRSYQQHLIQAEFKPIVAPSAVAALMTEADLQRQLGEAQTIAATDAKKTLKDLKPAIEFAEKMLIDLPRWAILVLVLASLGCLGSSYSSKLGKRQ